MNVSFAFGAAVVAAAFVVSSASANVSDSKALGRFAAAPSTLIVDAHFAQGHEVISGMPARDAQSRVEASKQASQRYYDFDVIVTLGALAMASGAFVAAGIAGSRRRAADAPKPREGWREQVMQALEADLAQFTLAMRRAA